MNKTLKRKRQDRGDEPEAIEKISFIIFGGNDNLERKRTIEIEPMLKSKRKRCEDRTGQI